MKPVFTAVALGLALAAGSVLAEEPAVAERDFGPQVRNDQTLDQQVSYLAHLLRADEAMIIASEEVSSPVVTDANFNSIPDTIIAALPSWE